MSEAASPDVVYIDLGRVSVTRDSLSPEEREAIDTLNAQVGRAARLAEVMDGLFESTLRICACERMALGILEEDGARLTLHWARAAYEPILLKQGAGEDILGSTLATIFEDPRCRIIPDMARFAERHPDDSYARLLLEEGVASSMITPLMAGEDVVGLLFRESRAQNAFGEHQLALHLMIASPLALAVHTTIKIEALEAANRAYLEMLAFVSHELKNPLASMVTDTRLLHDGFLGELNERQKAKVNRITHKGEYLLDLIKEYLDLARVEGGSMRINLRHGVDFMAEVVEPAIYMLRSSLEEAEMELSSFVPDTRFGVECDAALVRIVMTNLLGNAIKYGRHGGSIRLHVNRLLEKLHVSVWNEGPGFAEAERQKLFRRFTRLNAAALSGRKGTGVGLYSSWRIVQLHNGRIRARSKEEEWAEFSFEIPQPVGPVTLRRPR